MSIINTFGEEVDDHMLDQWDRYAGKIKTQEDRAREAMRLIHDQGKLTDANNFVQKLKDDYGNGVSALCVVYNGTGDTVEYATYKDWLGQIWESPYPEKIKNGQWGAFLHVHPTGESTGSEGAVVYRGHNKNGEDRDYLLAWSVPWGPWYSNKAHCVVGNVDSFPGRWDSVKGALEAGSSVSGTNLDGCHIEVNIGGGTSPFFRATLNTPYGP